LGSNVPVKQNRELTEIPRHAAGTQTLYASTMNYSEYKALQALLFFSLPVIWCVWQLIALKRVPDTAEASERQERVGLTPTAPRPDEIG